MSSGFYLNFTGRISVHWRFLLFNYSYSSLGVFLSALRFQLAKHENIF
jgi:hypothetical protein